jgi:hypothetical protein
MKMWRKVVAALFVFAASCLVQCSMHTATPYDVNRPEVGEHVLIATQGSTFKDAVVQRVADRLGKRPAYVKVIDVAALREVRESDWNAIVVLHTWEMSKPPAAVKAFIERAQAPGKLVVLATSGNGGYHMAGVDTITSASLTAAAPAQAEEILARVEKILTVQSPQTSR